MLHGYGHVGTQMHWEDFKVGGLPMHQNEFSVWKCGSSHAPYAHPSCLFCFGESKVK